MKSTVSKHDFVEAFRTFDRFDQFQRDGLEALFKYLEQYEEDAGTEMELDVIQLCVDFTRYESLEEFRSDYGDEYETLEDIREHTPAIPIGDGPAFITQDF